MGVVLIQSILGGKSSQYENERHHFVDHYKRTLTIQQLFGILKCEIIDIRQQHRYSIGIRYDVPIKKYNLQIFFSLRHLKMQQWPCRVRTRHLNRWLEPKLRRWISCSSSCLVHDKSFKKGDFPELGDVKPTHIIIGAGSAGCVLANRLTEDPDNRVLLVEAGPKDHWWNWKIHMPAALMYNLCDSKYNWCVYRSVKLWACLCLL